MFHELFDALIVSPTVELLQRSDLHAAARCLRWGWHEAPLYAVLDRLLLAAPMSRQQFGECLSKIVADGPFGEVLRDATPPSPVSDVADSEEVALLVIDPQRSFTEGAWKRSIGPGGDAEVEPIRRAFDNCGALLRRLREKAQPVMFTRCPFPPDSYDWDARLEGGVEKDQPYFVKPGNSVLWPPTNGFAEWVTALLSSGPRTLLIAGCTLNSCVRVSAIETATRFGERGLRVAVDPSLAGARASNYLPSPLFGGRSPVESALQQVSAAGVEVLSEGASSALFR